MLDGCPVHGTRIVWYPKVRSIPKSTSRRSRRLRFRAVEASRIDPSGTPYDIWLDAELGELAFSACAGEANIALIDDTFQGAQSSGAGFPANRSLVHPSMSWVLACAARPWPMFGIDNMRTLLPALHSLAA
jgi:hypothetical protein